jgi:hypothetical protein
MTFKVAEEVTAIFRIFGSDAAGHKCTYVYEQRRSKYKSLSKLAGDQRKAA